MESGHRYCPRFTRKEAKAAEGEGLCKSLRANWSPSIDSFQVPFMPANQISVPFRVGQDM